MKPISILCLDFSKKKRLKMLSFVIRYHSVIFIQQLFLILLGFGSSCQAFSFISPKNLFLTDANILCRHPIVVSSSDPFSSRYSLTNDSKLQMTPSKDNEDSVQSKSSTSSVIKMNDVLFNCIERNQKKYSVDDEIGFGRILDAGTGSHSLRWIASLIHNSNNSASDKSLHISHFTAITADQNMKDAVLKEAKSLNIENKGDVIIGNWKDETLLQDEEKFDTILADYLVGAMDGFSPYFQDLIFERLGRHLKPGGKLYVVGLNPIPDKTPGDANVFCKVTKLRDACILLAGKLLSFLKKIMFITVEKYTTNHKTIFPFYCMTS